MKLINDVSIYFIGDILKQLYPFILTIIAGFSTLIGYLFIFIKQKKENVISASLGISSGVLLTISLIDLLPNSLILLSNSKINPLISLIITLLFLFLGIIISNFINKKFEKKDKSNNKLYKIGIISMLIIILHNIPEGIVTYITSINNFKLGISICIAITMHNIPEGISISVPIFYSTNDKRKAFIYTFFSGIAEPLGAIMAFLFLSKIIDNIVLSLMYSFIAGMMINISINELYMQSIFYNKNIAQKFLIIGIFIMLLTHCLIN